MITLIQMEKNNNHNKEIYKTNTSDVTVEEKDFLNIENMVFVCNELDSTCNILAQEVLIGVIFIDNTEDITDIYDFCTDSFPNYRNKYLE